VKKIQGNILTPEGFIQAEITYSEKIISIKEVALEKNNLQIIIPGFIDLHVHGGGGCDVMEAGAYSISTIAKTHARFGTTSFLATTMTAPQEDLIKSLSAMKPTYLKRKKDEARLLGVHLEGPFISSHKLGAQPDFVRAATLKEIQELEKIIPIKVLTMAPEAFNHLELIKELRKKMVIQIGHTNGTYDQGVEALAQGAKSFTHLFNAMSGFHHREPGMIGAALAHAHYAELIPDLLHVHPGAIRAALRAIPNLYFVTDATAATGMPDGEFKLGNQIVHKCLGGVRLANGTLAGSCLTMDQALRNLVSLNLTLEEASQRLSEIPAELIGLNDRGMIKEGYFSDFIILKNDLTIAQVFIEGEKV
jgi:N-acetylglucosamine-6-phosphate deacetylase